MQKHINLVDLVKSFPTNIFLQNLASIQKRTSPIMFAHLVEKSEKGSISNLSTKPSAAERIPRTALLENSTSARKQYSGKYIANAIPGALLWTESPVISDLK